MIAFFIPQPTDFINSNHRLHWAVRAKRTKTWREAARCAAHGLPRNQRVQVTVYIHKKTRRAYDAHNLTPTAKAVMDGIVDAGLIPDDTNAHLVGPDMRQGETRPDGPGLTIHIQPLDGPQTAP